MNKSSGRKMSGFEAKYRCIVEAAQTGIDPSTFRIYVLLLSFTNVKTRLCYPSVRTVADRVRRSERSVNTAIRRLEAFGLLIVRSKTGPKGVNHYEMPAFERKLMAREKEDLCTTKQKNASDK